MAETTVDTKQSTYISVISKNHIPVGEGIPLRENVDGVEVIRTTAWNAPGCHNGCGVKLHVKDGRLIKVEGDPDAPFNQGRLCVRCLAVPDAMYLEDRLLYPLKRARADRGKDTFERISWEEAYDTIEKNFREIIERYGAESIAFAQGTGRDIMPYITRLAWSMGSPNFGGTGLSGNSCYLPRIVGMATTMGQFWLADYSQQFVDRYDNPEWRPPGVIFNIGVNLLVSNSDGVMGHWQVECMKRGSKLINVDPKITWLSAHADLNLRIRPGTDGALAMGMINYLIESNQYDHEFVDKWCYGFEQLIERAEEYPLDKVAKITWLKADDIKKACDMIVEYAPAAMQWGLCADASNAEAVPMAHAIQTVFQITGNVDVPGGMILPTDILPGGLGGGWGRDLLSDEQWQKKSGAQKYPLLLSGVSTSSDELQLQIETGVPYEIHGYWNQTQNTIAAMTPEVEKSIKLFQEKIDFYVSVDVYKTPTVMAFADIVLPVCFFPERSGVALTTGSQRAAALVKVCEPLGEARSDQQINLELGKRFNPEGWPWDTVEDMFSEIVSCTGYKYDELCEKSPVLPQFEYRKYEKGMLRPDGQPGFNTISGRCELFCQALMYCGLDPLPHFVEPDPGPVSTPELFEKYPLILTTGTRRWSMFHSEHRNNPRMRALAPEPLAEMHPGDAKKYGVAEGDMIWLENHLGKAKRRLRVSTEMLEGNVQTDHGWWFPEGDPEDLYGIHEFNINHLLEYKCGKSGYGTNIKAQVCTVYKVEG
jgi:anaerobic selenocysteine-containing dehydrogenase